MEKIIISKLKEIEEKYDIEILFACESGSRAWGFPSTDSDYDVRFIYKRKKNHYMSVFEESTELGFSIVDDLDFVGWDIKKVFLLLHKSNVTPFEWLQSPIVYCEKEGFQTYMKSVFIDFYVAKRHIHHYLGIVRGRMESVSFEEMKLKSFFYIMRSLLSAYWSMKFGTYAPMEFEPLMTLLPEKIKVSCKELRSLKLELEESFVFSLSDELRTFIIERQDEIWTYADTLDAMMISKELANVGFLKILEDDYRSASC
ncbi:nucleotidyltransferase domain-containing protein [Sphingobacterium bovistauri]|uniref:Nucleotidyltransferase domain-containing protein n=1 Tax=Sphingobacterium bovistauri TaxID=2781959 RepID=A0ABS7Z200_9SPHI|nr:nucleotidyltransferase domain-containing protein [Sphingobacterium bovistauri]MCA5004198.1 nucleotidyltransferase domain-containing protein [Sphingobacterium bovistauri]